MNFTIFLLDPLGAKLWSKWVKFWRNEFFFVSKWAIYFKGIAPHWRAWFIGYYVHFDFWLASQIQMKRMKFTIFTIFVCIRKICLWLNDHHVCRFLAKFTLRNIIFFSTPYRIFCWLRNTEKKSYFTAHISIKTKQLI